MFLGSRVFQGFFKFAPRDSIFGGLARAGENNYRLQGFWITPKTPKVVKDWNFAKFVQNRHRGAMYTSDTSDASDTSIIERDDAWWWKIEDYGKSKITYSSLNNHNITNTWSCVFIFCRHTKHTWNYVFSLNKPDLWWLSNECGGCTSDDLSEI